MSTQGAQPPLQERSSCPQCKSKITSDAKFCPNCGEKLLQDQETVSSKPSEESRLKQQHWIRTPKSLLDWTQSVANVAQVLALILAGIWAYNKFYESERPSLEPHLSSIVALKWRNVPGVKSTCEAEVAITLENTGKASADITDTTISVWLTPFKGDFKEPQVVDEGELTAGTPLFQKTLTQSYLVGHFPPGVKAEEDLNFWIPRNTGQIAYVDVEFTSKKKMNHPPGGSDWDYVCNVRE